MNIMISIERMEDRHVKQLYLIRVFPPFFTFTFLSQLSFSLLLLHFFSFKHHVFQQQIVLLHYILAYLGSCLVNILKEFLIVALAYYLSHSVYLPLLFSGVINPFLFLAQILVVVDSIQANLIINSREVLGLLPEFESQSRFLEFSMGELQR